MASLNSLISFKTMNIARSIIALSLALSSTSALAQNRPLLELMVERLLNNQMPKVLLTANNIPWSGGNMNVVITKTGQARLNENSRDVLLDLPIEAHLKGAMKQAVGPLEIDMNCEVKFQSLAKVKLAPTLRRGKLVSSSDVVIPVPPVNANCDGVSLPVAPALKIFIEQNSSHLEADINKMVEKYLN